MNEEEWRDKFFFVKRSSISEGISLPIEEWERKFVATSKDDIPVTSSAHSASSQQSQAQMTSKFAFDLEDLSDFLTIKKEKPSPVVPKARIMHTRLTKTSTKRKGTDVINADDIPDFYAADLLQKAILKIIGDKEAFEKQIEDLEDQNKITVAKAGYFEKKTQKLNKLVKDNASAHKLKVKEIIEGTKKSAVVAILKAKIQMAEKSKQDGSDLWDKDLADWVKVMAKLTGDMAETSDAAAKTTSVVETSKAAEDEDTGVVAGAGGAMMGNEDRADKV
ncbi:hypothetical protein E3N88_06832 [Mikania micrantha]|uniref:Uncharacterized protein n=1 Tax=Mikania micrantha TaxID=192012 RepID=A0A5N6PR46_9ASTR|nr:hypothetical protein E3N88_06832 [Mikania micrantha]